MLMHLYPSLMWTDSIIPQTSLSQTVDTATTIVIGDMLLVLGGYSYGAGAGYRDYIQYAILPPSVAPTDSTVNPTDSSLNPAVNPTIPNTKPTEANSSPLPIP
eukprot:392840_1